MRLDEIRKHLEGRFVPFKLCTSDGRQFKVPHPEFIFLTASFVVVADRRGSVYVLEPLHIVSIEKRRSLPVS